MSLYDQYYTSADVNVYLHNPVTDLRVHIDTIVGIGFRHSISAVPVYEIGNMNPAFFSRGNSLVTGSLDLAFKSSKYLTNILKYLESAGAVTNQITTFAAESNALESLVTPDGYKTVGSIKATGSVEFQTPATIQKEVKVEATPVISIGSFANLINIEIIFDNSNSNYDGRRSMITIYGVRLTEFTTGAASQAEGAISDRYGFIGKNITSVQIPKVVIQPDPTPALASSGTSTPDTRTATEKAAGAAAAPATGAANNKVATVNTRNAAGTPALAPALGPLSPQAPIIPVPVTVTSILGNITTVTPATGVGAPQDRGATSTTVKVAAVAVPPGIGLEPLAGKKAVTSIDISNVSEYKILNRVGSPAVILLSSKNGRVKNYTLEPNNPSNIQAETIKNDNSGFNLVKAPPGFVFLQYADTKTGTAVFVLTKNN